MYKCNYDLNLIMKTLYDNYDAVILQINNKLNNVDKDYNQYNELIICLMMDT